MEEGASFIVVGVAGGRKGACLLERVREVVEVARTLRQHLDEVVAVRDQLLHVDVSPRFRHHSLLQRSETKFENLVRRGF